MQHAAQHLDAFFELVHADFHFGELDAVCVVFDLRPTGANTHLGATVAEVIDGGDCFGENRGVAIANGVHQRADAHPRGLARQRCMHSNCFKTLGVVGLAGGAVEVIPDRDPPVSERFNAPPRSAQIVAADVL